MKLRDYQERQVSVVREAISRVQSVLLVSPTGSGKTVVASYISRGASARGLRVMFLAHMDTLLKQTSSKLREYEVEHGMIMPAYTPQSHKLVQVASVQTLVRRLHIWKQKVDILLIDEAHLSAAKSYMKVAEALLAINPHMKIIGVTGSPTRLDGRGLGRRAGGLFDEIAIGISPRELMEDGYLVRPVVYAPATRIDLSNVKTVAGDFDPKALADVMDKPKLIADAVEMYQRICPGVPAVAWCASIAHAQHVAAQFTAAGIPAMTLSGENDTTERDAALARLAAGDIKVITFAQLLTTGVDCPAIGAVLMLRPTMSLASYLQTVGRGLRPIYADGFDLSTREGRIAAMLAGPKNGKCYLLDHAGMTFRHGFADDDREWSLDGAPKRKGKKKEKEETLDLKQCPKCFVVHPPAPSCPSCGHIYEVKARKIEHEDGELKEITPEMRQAMSQQARREQGRADTLEALQELAARKGYSEGWARAVFEARKRKAAKKAPGIRRPEPPPEAYPEFEAFAHEVFNSP